MTYNLWYRGIGHNGIRKEYLKKYFTIYFLLLLVFSISIPACSYPQDQNEKLLTGADLLLKDHLDLIKGKRLGIVTNHTAVLINGTYLVDTLRSYEDITITALFGPEHGIGGTSAAGEEINSNKDSKKRIPVYSLYGSVRKPTTEMLSDVDIILYDIQDVGVRFYTYISTLFYVLQAAAENDIPVIVLDRPNPINGVTVKGPILKDELSSFVGIAPIPVQYGMTVGEMAKYFSGEGLLGNNLQPELTVIKIEDWKRENLYSDYNLNWIPPSPNIPTFHTALVYPGTCFIEGTNVSEGRGTRNAFTTIGAPFINSSELIAELNNQNLEGIKLDTITFTPENIPGMANNPKYENEACNGIFITITDEDKFKGFEFGLNLISALIKLYPESFSFTNYFDTLAGDKVLRELLLQKKPVDEISKVWQDELNNFKSIRTKYLLY